MTEIVVSQSTVKLTPSTDWSWYGWDGIVNLSHAPHTVSAAGKELVLEPDIVAAIAEQAAGKSYTATGFADTPGAAAAIVPTADQGTLAQTVQVESMKPVVNTTEGTFVMTVGMPSTMLPPSGPPVPDPGLVKNGTWKIEQSAQSNVTAK